MGDPIEGKIYIISNFKVENSKKLNAVVSNSKCIIFLSKTTMELYPKEEDLIPLHKFELISLND